MKEIDCAFVEEQDVVALYLKDRLEEPAAEAFEKHYFGCEHCWNALNLASQVRASRRRFSAQAVRKAARGASRDLWAPLAAAAAIAVVALGLARLAQQPAVESDDAVFRGGTTNPFVMNVRALGGGRIVLEWQHVPAARIYRVDVFRSDGLPVFSKETSESHLTLNAAALPMPPPGISFLIRLEATDATGAKVGTSELKPLLTR